ncbi:MAG: Hsp70 family protein [Myxococcota bacterium]
MWALDLGTTNTAFARWDADARRPELVELPDVCRRPGGKDPLDAPRMVPSAVDALATDAWARLGRLPLLREHAFVGTEAHIGRPALEANEAWPHPTFAPTFKSALARDPMRTLARRGGEPLTARDVARMYLRELLRSVKAATGQRPRELVVTVPVASYDAYRAEVRSLCEHHGVKTVRFVDEPVAAALGYGVGLDRPRDVLVVDMGGGTLHVAMVRLSPRAVEAGGGDVLGKEGRAVGGNLVDRWVLEDACAALGVPLARAPSDETEVLWQRLMLAEARRVKEALHLREADTFTISAPEELRGLHARLVGRPHALDVTRDRLAGVLAARGLYTLLDETVASVVAQAGHDPEEVLLVGGSTLLPGVYPRLEARFGRDRVRAWQPFEAVALGGAAFAGGGWHASDFVVHDYALVTHDPKTQAQQHHVVVPRGTRFPTPPGFWRRQLVPTCALGVPETFFKLVIVEIGRFADDARRFGWDASGHLHVVGADEPDVIVPLNAANPALGRLDPPHAPGDRRPRLDVELGVDGDRWLVATVRDLHSGKALLKDEPVVRLL